MSTTPDMGDALASVAHAAGGYFKSTKSKTIALIIAGVLLIGTLGAISALAFGGNPEVPTAPSVTDPGDVFQPVPETPDETPTPGPTVNPSTPTNSVTIEDNVTFPVPEGWEVVGKGARQVLLRSGPYLFYATLVSTKSTNAVAIVPSVLTMLFPEDQYTTLNAAQPEPIQTEGGFVSAANLTYSATRGDLQSSEPVVGDVAILIRQDGEVLVLNPEYLESAMPLPDKIQTSVEAILDGAVTSFGGLS